VEGEMRLVIGGKSRVYRKGDWYFIPEGVVHSAIFLTKVNAIDIFDDPKRYRIKREQIEK
jgi:quercetin dioxygenase-like cupin family protein